MNEKDLMEYTTIVINDFADFHDISVVDASEYLYDFGGLDYLEELCETKHRFSLDDAVARITDICRENGGDL